MKIPEERLKFLILGCSISSGPDVCIYFDCEKEDITFSLHRPRTNSYIMLYEYKTLANSLRGDLGRKVEKEIREAIENFRSPRELRDERLNEILK